MTNVFDHCLKSFFEKKRIIPKKESDKFEKPKIYDIRLQS